MPQVTSKFHSTAHPPFSGVSDLVPEIFTGTPLISTTMSASWTSPSADHFSVWCTSLVDGTMRRIAAGGLEGSVREIVSFTFGARPSRLIFTLLPPSWE